VAKKTSAKIDDGGQPRSARSFAEELLEIRRRKKPVLPVKAHVAHFGDAILHALFPHFCDETYYAAEEIDGELRLVRRDLLTALAPLAASLPRPAAEVADRCFAALPDIHALLWRDAEAIHAGDPAAESVDEVISAYPGFLAIAFYRVAHRFYRLGVPIFPRILAEVAHQRTGVDIHPGAVIGEAFCIDHGTGIVIGETSVIGDRVKIYQGVTLGALSVDKSLSTSKRHPTIEDDVVIYSNATILGGATVVGHHSVIGGNVWLTSSVPPHSVVVHSSEIRVRNGAAGGVPDFVI
jgi:serine O-acetyltransferase